MNSHMLHQLFLQLWTALQHVADVVKRSKIRRWLQQKSRRSAALRAAFVLVAMGLAHQVLFWCCFGTVGMPGRDRPSLTMRLFLSCTFLARRSNSRKPS